MEREYKQHEPLGTKQEGVFGRLIAPSACSTTSTGDHGNLHSSLDSNTVLSEWYGELHSWVDWAYCKNFNFCM
jgi:hypothetical protein